MRTLDGSVTLWGNGTLHAPVTFEKGSITISVRAYGNRVDGEAPVLRVLIADREVGTLVIDSADAKEFMLKAKAESHAVAELVLSFDNYVAAADPLFSRWLVVDAVAVHQE